jgi:hypothetical protein
MKREKKPITIKLNQRQREAVRVLSRAARSAQNDLMLYLVATGDASKATIPEDWGVTSYNMDNNIVTFGPPREQPNGEPTPEGTE